MTKLFGLLLTTLMLLTWLIVSQHVQAIQSKPMASSAREMIPTALLLYQVEGHTISRALPAEESRQWSNATNISGSPLTAGLNANAQQDNVRFILNATPQLENSPEAKAAFLRAAAKWEAAVGARFPPTPFQVRVNVDFSPTFFGTAYPSPDAIGGSVVRRTGLLSVIPFSRLFGRLATAPQQRIIYEALPFPINTETGGSETLEWPAALDYVVGFNALETPHAIGFNSNIRFDFDPSDGIDPDKLDFEALVLRELGRVLGFISNVGAREINPDPRPGPLGPLYSVPTILDYFRFRPGVTMESFTTAPRVELSGGEQIFFTGDLELPLSTARPDGQGGDGRPAAHWKDDELTGQYIGVMDPTYARGERGGITANDLAALRYFGYQVRVDAPVLEVLSVDDNSPEETLPYNGALIVNRFTPARYPFTVQSVRVRLPQPSNGTSPVGKQLRIVVFADTARAGQPPGNPSLLVDRTITIPALPANRMLEVMLPNVPTISSGDLYVGFQASGAEILLAADRSGKQFNRSFISTNNGASFQPVRSGDAPINFMARAVVTTTFEASNNAAAELTALSPDTAPMDDSVDIYVYGSNFKPESEDASGFNYSSVVRWNGQPKHTVFLSQSLLRTQVLPADLAGGGKNRVSVFTSGPDGGSESNALEFTVSANSPAPVITRLDPPAAGTGAAQIRVTVFGRNFVRGSVVRWNGNNQPTTFVDSAELQVTIPASDLTNPGGVEVTVFTPTPGGGASNAVVFNVAACSYALSFTEQLSRANLSGSVVRGVLLTTDSHCSWSVQSNVPWITVIAPTSGAGTFPVNFRVEDNNTTSARSGTLTIGGRTLTIRQPAGLTAVSAATYQAPLASQSIASIFGTELAHTTQGATTTPLPTDLTGTQVQITAPGRQPQTAPLFFVSPTQINFLVPLNVVTLPPEGSAVIVSVVRDGNLVAEGRVPWATVAPGLFSASATGSGLAAAVVLRVKADGSQSYEPVGVFDSAQDRFVARPIDLGPEGEKVFLLLFGTGIRGRSQLTAVKATIGGLEVPVAFAGAQGDLVGLDQINVELPRALRGRGDVSVTAMVDRSVSNSVTVRIQ